MTGSRSMHWILCSLAAAALALAGCGSDTTSGEASGSLNLNLELAEGVTINQVDWTISGGDMEPMSGTIDTSAPGATASVEVFGLPPGDGYLVELEATDESGEITCKGSAEFSVEVGVSTDIMVFLNCKRPERLGGVRVNGKFNICADLAKVVVSPLQTSVGNDIDLSAIGQDAEGDAITYVWSATGGTLGDSNAQETTYTCGQAGEQSITISVSDDAFEYCVDEWTVPVTCVPGDNGDLCEGVDCDDQNECTADACNPEDGSCSNTAVDDGTSCQDGAGECMNGECVVSNLCAGVDCSDGNECTDDVCNPEDGSCSNPAVDDGTSCLDGAGMCVSGECMVSDLCEGVTCDPTGNECTFAECNNQTGECDVMNVPNGTECDGGEGACSNGECVVTDLCDGVDCTSADECVQDGTCDPGNGQCIPGDPQPINTTCTAGGNFCDGQGNCVECNNDDQCDGADECVDNVCMAGAVDPAPQSQVITVGCGNNVTADVSILPYELEVDPGPIAANQGFTATLGGVAEFSETFLDAAQGAVVGGVAKAGLVDLIATVQTRGDGATGANVGLTAGGDLGFECWLFDTGPGVQDPCDPANDLASIPGARGNTDCLGIAQDPCLRIVEVPISDDQATCDGLGKIGQFDSNGFCVTGGLPIPIDENTGSYTAGASGSTALFGWFDNPASDSPGVGTPAIDGDDTYNMLQPNYDGTAGPVGLAVFAGLNVQLECVMAVDAGGPDGVGVPDDASPTPDANLIAFPIP